MRKSPSDTNQNRWVCLPKVPKDGQIKVQIWAGEADQGLLQRGRAQPHPPILPYPPQFYGLLPAPGGFGPSHYLGLRWEWRGERSLSGQPVPELDSSKPLYWPPECRPWVTKEQGEGLSSAPTVMMPLSLSQTTGLSNGAGEEVVSTVWGLPRKPREVPAKRGDTEGA